jgi:hypothetical protein
MREIEIIVSGALWRNLKRVKWSLVVDGRVSEGREGVRKKGGQCTTGGEREETEGDGGRRFMVERLRSLAWVGASECEEDVGVH